MNLSELRMRYASLDAYGGARLVTLGDGGERGVRVIEFRTGGGLDLEVVVDRGFDIGRVAIGGALSPRPARSAPPRSPTLIRSRQGYLRAASGFLVTCGFDHIRQPETDAPTRRRYILPRRSTTPCTAKAPGNRPVSSATGSTRRGPNRCSGRKAKSSSP